MNSLLIVSENKTGTTAAKLCTDLIVNFGTRLIPGNFKSIATPNVLAIRKF